MYRTVVTFGAVTVICGFQAVRLIENKREQCNCISILPIVGHDWTDSSHFLTCGSSEERGKAYMHFLCMAMLEWLGPLVIRTAGYCSHPPSREAADSLPNIAHPLHSSSTVGSYEPLQILGKIMVGSTVCHTSIALLALPPFVLSPSSAVLAYEPHNTIVLDYQATLAEYVMNGESTWRFYHKDNNDVFTDNNPYCSPPDRK